MTARFAYESSVRKNCSGDNHFIEIADFFQSFTIIINRAQSLSPITLPRLLTRFPTFIIISPVELLIHDCVPGTCSVTSCSFPGKLSCCIGIFDQIKANLAKIQPQTTKMSKNSFLTKSPRGQWVETSIILAYFRDSRKRNLDFRDP